MTEKSLVIIPTYNELENITTLIPEILNKYKNVDLDILIVDDNSPDGTGIFVKELMQKTERVKLLERDAKQGLGTAYIAGFKYAEENFYDNFSAFSKYLGNGDYLICFNKNHFWSERFRRFTLAHELGHLSMPTHVSILNKNLLHRSKTEYSSREPIEIEADKFAINFLLIQLLLILIFYY